MKKSYFVSPEKKSKSKQNKLVPISLKPIHKSIGDQSSPALIKKDFLIKDLSKSPRSKRSATSHLLQNLSPKADNSKHLVPGKLNFNDMNSSNERSENETEKKSDVELTLEIENLSIEPSHSRWPQVHRTKESLSSNALEISDTIKPFNQGRSGSKTGRELLEPENLEYLQSVIKSQTSDYETLEKSYYVDTNSLKREVEKQKANCRRFEAELLNLRTRTGYFTQEIEDLTKKVLILKKENEEKSKELLSDISNKDAEIIKLSEMIKKVKLDRKSQEELIKDLQREVSVLTTCNKILESDIISTKKTLNTAQESLEAEKMKSQLVDAQKIENTKLRILNNELEGKLKDTLSQLDYVNRNFNSMQTRFNTIREELEAKDEKSGRAACKQPENSSLSKSTARTSLRRMLTLNNYPPSDESQRDSMNRLYQRITNLEEELQSEIMEKEKVSRNLDYTKKIVEEKSQIISKLELEIESADHLNKEVENGPNLKEANGLTKKCKDALEEIQNYFMCSKCKISLQTKFISLSCSHMFCKDCAKGIEICVCCSSGTRLMKLDMLSKISSKVNQVYDLLTNISKYL